MTFPPSSPTTLQDIIKSYLYVQYNDDDDLQAFVDAYNGMAQTMLDWFNQNNLADYTSLQGSLLDWVAEGLYGISRPTLTSGTTQAIGTINSFAINSLAINDAENVGAQTYYLTSDDVFKRIITWAFWKGDGKTFNVRWLKRRIMRFLSGTNGGAGQTDNTYQVSVSFSGDNQVNVTILAGIRTYTSGPINSYAIGDVPAINDAVSTYQDFASQQYLPQLLAALAIGALELPVQYIFVINGQTIGA